MTKLKEDTVEYLAHLCRIACNEEEKHSIGQDLNQILAYVDRLEQCDTQGIEPLSYVVSGHEQLILRDDIEEPSLDKEAFFRLAPAHIAGLIKVPTILEE